MAYDFTADSDAQTELSSDLNTHASDFEIGYKKLYSQIDGLSSTWVGEDYDAFQEGTHGYETALGDLKNGIDLFAKHFERMATGTKTLATELVDIIQNATEGNGAGGAGDPNGNPDGSTPGGTDTTDPETLRTQTKSDGSVNPYGGETKEYHDPVTGAVTYEYYDEEGNLRQTDVWDANGKLIKQETLDADKNPIYSMVVNADDGSYVVQRYDGENLASYEEFDSDDNPTKSIKYEYDEDGKLKSKITDEYNGTYYEELYNTYGDVIGYKLYDSESGESLFENFSDAALISSILAAGGRWEISSDGSYAIIDVDEDGKGTVYNYNKSGDKTSQVEYSDSDHITSEETYNENGLCTGRTEYDYDSEGRLKTKENYDGEGTTLISKEEYVYDKDGNYSVTTTDAGGNTSVDYYDKDGNSIDAPETFGPDGSLLTEEQIKINAENSANDYLATHGIDTTGSDYANLTPSAKAFVDQTVQTVTDVGPSDGSVAWQEKFKNLSPDLQKLVINEYRGDVSPQTFRDPYGITHTIPSDGKYDGRNIVVPSLTQNDFNASYNKYSLKTKNAQIIIDSANEVKTSLLGEATALSNIAAGLDSNPGFMALSADEQRTVKGMLEIEITSRNNLAADIESECSYGFWETDGTIGDAVSANGTLEDTSITYSEYADYQEAASTAEAWNDALSKLDSAGVITAKLNSYGIFFTS